MKARKSSLHRLFPNTNVAAYYDPFAQIINLCKYNRSDFIGVDINNPDSKTIDKVALFEHELTHWLDHVSTLWGQENLVLIYNALSARANDKIDEFWRIKRLFNSINGDDFYDYYTEEYNLHKIPARSPWRYQISSGIRFSENGTPEHNKPILFMRFNCFDDIPLIRVPVSVASILESNAINAEFSLKIAIAHTIKDPIERNLNLANIKSEWTKILYDKDFALYTVVAHLTANSNNQSNVVLTYEVSSSIGTTILNIPSTLYTSMLMTQVGNNEWDRRIKEFQNNKDRGFAFYNLLKNLIDKNGKNKYDINELLECSGLPNKKQLEDMVILEMERNKESLIDGPFKNMALELISKGIEVFKLRGLDGKNMNFRKELTKMNFLPKIIFGDTDFDESKFSVSEVLDRLRVNQVLSIEDKYLVCSYYDKKFREFISICGV